MISVISLLLFCSFKHICYFPLPGTKQQLVTDVDSDDKSQPPGLGMKLTVAGLNKKFPNVKNISTGQLSNWIKQVEGQTKEQMDTGTENLVILVNFIHSFVFI